MKSRGLLAVACMAVLMVGCNSRSQTSNTIATSNEAGTTGTAGSGVSASDKNFVNDILSDGMAEVEIAKIASKVQGLQPWPIIVSPEFKAMPFVYVPLATKMPWFTASTASAAARVWNGCASVPFPAGAAAPSTNQITGPATVMLIAVAALVAVPGQPLSDTV